MSWIYQSHGNRKDRPQWVIGFFNPDGDFIKVAILSEPTDAAELVHYLNGGSPCVQQ